jgi:hypothetical protein
MSSRASSKPGWSDVKRRLADFDRAGLLALVQELYTANRDTQAFLHARFDLAHDVLEPYKATIRRWLWPDVFKRQDVSVAKAKKAIADYRKAIGRPAELAELTVFYCEQAAGFSKDIGLQDEGYFAALVRMFEQALVHLEVLPDSERNAFVARLNEVRRTSHNFGYGVGDDLDRLMAESRFD